MKKLFLMLFLFGIMSPMLAQVTEPEELREVELVAVNYKYLDATTNDEVAVPVKLLQEKVAKYDVRSSDFYQDDYELYEVNFFIPQGTVLAAYDKDGKLLKTVERYKNVGLPSAVMKAVKEKYPNFTISKDIYLVNYHDEKGIEKRYKLKLEDPDNNRVRIKIDEKGNFL